MIDNPTEPTNRKVRAERILARLKLEAEVLAVVRMRMYDGLSLRETAQALSLSKTAAERRWKLFERTLMRQCWESGEFDDALLFGISSDTL